MNPRTSQELIRRGLVLGAQFSNGAAEIDRVPEDHGGNREIEAGSAIALVLEGTPRSAQRRQLDRAARPDQTSSGYAGSGSSTGRLAAKSNRSPALSTCSRTS